MSESGVGRVYRHALAVLHPSGSKLLTLDGALPERVAETSWLSPGELLSGVPCEPLLLDTLAHRETLGGGALLHALQAREAGPLPEGARWVGVNELDGHPEAEALRGLLLEDAGLRPIPELRPAWARRGWLEAVKGWLETELTRLGRSPVGEPEQLKHWSLSAVLRQNTSRGPVYFKATMTPHFAREGPVTRLLAGLFPDLIPAVLAHDAARSWLLLEPFPGEPLSDADLETKCAAPYRHAEVQIDAVQHLDALLAAGCEERRLGRMKERLPTLLRESLELALLENAEREALLALESPLLARMDALAGCGVPETLLHGDLHFGNVAHEAGRFTLFDWTDAAIGHPFFDLITIRNPWQDEAEWPALRDAYLGPWRSSYPQADIDGALAHALLLGHLFQAESHEGIYRAQEPRARWTLAGVAAHHFKKVLAAGA